MNTDKNLMAKFLAVLVSCILAVSTAHAQKEENEQDEVKTKQAQAVSKKVYDKILEAQEKIDEEDFPGALRTLDALRRNDKLTPYERTNVLNYIGFVYYSTDNVSGPIDVYKEMLTIPDLEPQLRIAAP